MNAIVSNYPESFDERHYFSDVSLMNRDIVNEHRSLLSLRKYREASEKLHDSKIDYYSAELFNYFEECLYKIGTRIQATRITSGRPFYQQEMPSVLADSTVWISSEEL